MSTIGMVLLIFFIMTLESTINIVRRGIDLLLV